MPGLLLLPQPLRPPAQKAPQRLAVPVLKLRRLPELQQLASRCTCVGLLSTNKHDQN